MIIESIIFYLLLIDSIAANFVTWYGQQWWNKHFRSFSRWFPLAQGWALYYLVLVIWIGSLLYRLGGLWFF